MDNSFTACDIGQLFALSCVGADDGAEETAGFPCFTAEPVGEDDRLIAPLPAGRGGGSTQFPHTAGDLGRHVIQRFGRFLCQQGLGLCEQVQAVLFGDGKGLPAGRGVRHRGAAGDHVQRIAQNITKHDTEHSSDDYCLVIDFLRHCRRQKAGRAQYPVQSDRVPIPMLFQ